MLLHEYGATITKTRNANTNTKRRNSLVAILLMRTSEFDEKWKMFTTNISKIDLALRVR